MNLDIASWPVPLVLGSSLLSGNYIAWWIAQVVAVVILVTLVLRWRPGFMGGRTIGETLGAALDARAQQIQTQLEAAERSRQEAARIREESAGDIEQARKEAEDILSRAGHTSEMIQRDMQSRAEEEYQRIVGQARSAIEYERQQAELALRRQAADIVVDAAREVVARNLDAPADRQIIDDSLSRLERI